MNQLTCHWPHSLDTSSKPNTCFTPSPYLPHASLTFEAGVRATKCQTKLKTTAENQKKKEREAAATLGTKHTHTHAKSHAHTAHPFMVFASALSFPFLHHFHHKNRLN